MQSDAVVHRHLLLWRDPPVWPFVWRGLLPLLGLALVALFAFGTFARGWIEGTVQRETREQLNAAGYGWVGLKVSGQNVTLSGVEPTTSAGERAIALAKGASCPTWLGRRTCAVSVVGDFTSPAPTLAAAPTPVAQPVQAAAQACERSLASLLAGEEIEFGSGSAAISARSAGNAATEHDSVGAQRAQRAAPGQPREAGARLSRQHPHRGPHRQRGTLEV